MDITIKEVPAEGDTTDHCAACDQHPSARGERAWEGYWSKTARRPMWTLCENESCWTLLDMNRPN